MNSIRRQFLLLGLLPMSLASLAATVDVPVNPTPRFDKFQETQITSIAPQGWLKEFLVRQNTGLTGHHDVLSYPFNTCLWAGMIPRQGGHGCDWWRYEQTAYLSDGMIRLGYLLNDPALIKDGRAGVEYVMAHPQKNGRLGYDFFTSQWPIAVYFRVIQAEYLATGNPEIIKALQTHYLSYSKDDLIKGHRHIVNIEGMLWTYGKTGDKRLLEMAETAYRAFAGELPMKDCASPKKIVIHGVTYMEKAKLPTILYIYTGKQEYLDAALNALRKLDRDHMLPDGVPSSNEYLCGKDPLQSHETCDISDYTWSAGYMLMATGDATWADHIERAIFNAGPGCVSKDFKNLQYFSSPNQVIAAGDSNQNKYFHGSTWMAYWPCHETECCAGNVHRFMPNYAARMWMRDNLGGLVAAFYGPSVKTLALDGGKQILKVTEETNYPFSDTITFRFETPERVKFPFSFRIPAWCQAPGVTINGEAYQGELKPGTFVTLNREVAPGDVIKLQLPMPVRLQNWERYGVMVERGPLLFAYPVPEKVTIDTRTYANLRGKKSPSPDFPPLDLRPAGAWNYALAASPETAGKQFQMVETGATGYPFDPATIPVVIKVPAQKVPTWTLQENRFTPSLPRPGHVACAPEAETITLVPYGSTRLRLAVFPSAIPKQQDFKVTASSTEIGYSPEGAADGVADGYPGNQDSEWASKSEKAGAWVKIEWTEAKTISGLLLYDRPNPEDQVLAATIAFDDGSTVAVGELANDGQTPAKLAFPPRKVKSLTFRIDKVSATTKNAGIAEIELIP